MTCLHCDGQGIEERMFCAAGDDDVARLILKAILPLELSNDSLSQCQCACNRGVAGVTAFDGLATRNPDVFRRIEIGLANRQVDDVLALALQLGESVCRSTAC